MSNERDRMIKLLREKFVPLLRQRGFKGSFPHFRRVAKDKTDVLSFQFDKWGGGFFLELGEGPVDVFTTHWGKKIPANELKVFDLDIEQRVRLYPGPNEGGRESWFRFDTKHNEAFNAAIKQLLELFPQADSWLAGQRQQPNIH